MLFSGWSAMFRGVIIREESAVNPICGRTLFWLNFRALRLGRCFAVRIATFLSMGDFPLQLSLHSHSDLGNYNKSRNWLDNVGNFGMHRILYWIYVILHIRVIHCWRSTFGLISPVRTSCEGQLWPSQDRVVLNEKKKKDHKQNGPDRDPSGNVWCVNCSCLPNLSHLDCGALSGSSHCQQEKKCPATSRIASNISREQNQLSIALSS